MNGMALCAGGGGLDLAMQVAIPGYRTVCYVEREAGAAASLVARMEDQTLDQAPVWDDLGTLDGRPWRGLVDCITSGDPCQPNSNAGKGLGEDDDRWLIDQVVRIVEEVRPFRVFRENVTGNADGQLETIIPALERLGYRVAAGIFAASEVGASHERQRLFILADRQSPRQQSGGHRCGLATEHAEPDYSGADMADPESQRCGKTGRRGGAGDTGTGQPGTELANAIGGGHHGRTQDTQRQEIKRTVVEGSGTSLHGVGLADAGSTGLQGGERAGPSGERHGTPAHGPATELRSARIPLYAPGPGDFDAWREILAIDPLLEPALCRTAHELAHRNDRLRLCGNGVFPLEGAYAYRTLDALLASDRGTTAIDVLNATQTAQQAVA